MYSCTHLRPENVLKIFTKKLVTRMFELTEVSLTLASDSAIVSAAFQLKKWWWFWAWEDSFFKLDKHLVLQCAKDRLFFDIKLLT